MKNAIMLSRENAKSLVNWYNTEGQSNWGVWGNYPSLPVGASYNSFDTCLCRILFDKDVFVEGSDEVFNCIATSRKVPGSKVKNSIGFETLLELSKSDEEKFLTTVNGWRSDYKRAKEVFQMLQAYNNQPNEIKERIKFLHARLLEINGKPNSKAERMEIDKELSNYIPLTTLSDDHWMLKAIKFVEEDYVKMKIEESKKNEKKKIKKNTLSK